jgi:hypothetical protein
MKNSKYVVAVVVRAKLTLLASALSAGVAVAPADLRTIADMIDDCPDWRSMLSANGEASAR